MLVALLSDVHIGHRCYNNDSLVEIHNNLFKQTIELIIKNKVNIVVIAGDLFDKIIPSVESINLVIEQFGILNSYNIEICLIEGNHDTVPVNHNKSFLHLLDAYILKDDCYLEIDNVNIYGINWTVSKINNKILNISTNKSKCNILALHSSIPEQSAIFSGSLNVDAIKHINDNFNICIMGHIHQKAEYNNILVCGGINVLSFGEITEKGFYIYNTDDLSYKYINTTPPQFIVTNNIEDINDSSVVYKLNMKNSDVLDKSSLKYLHLIVNKLKPDVVHNKATLYTTEELVLSEYMKDLDDSDYDNIMGILYNKDFSLTDFNLNSVK